jgi:hypothetical protein
MRHSVCGGGGGDMHHLGEWAEDLAWAASEESGLTDRPDADPRVLAVCYLGLRLCPRPRAEARLVGSRIIYPAEADEQGACYFVSHEVGHEIAIAAECPAAAEERVASRIGVAIMLPRPAYRRDLAAVGWDLAALCRLWPLASPWIHARRIAEVAAGATVASRWTSSGCVDRVTSGRRGSVSDASGVEMELAWHALRGERIERGERARAWPIDDGAIVVCDVRAR